MQRAATAGTVGRQDTFGFFQPGSGSWNETGRQVGFQGRLDLFGLPGQAALGQFRHYPLTGVAELLPQAARRKKPQSLLEMCHSQRNLARQDAHPSRLEQKQGSPRAVAGDCTAGKFCECLGCAGVIANRH